MSDEIRNSERPGSGGIAPARRWLSLDSWAVLVALAILLRLQPILSEPSAVWADEIFQTSEPAHRL